MGSQNHDMASSFVETNYCRLVHSSKVYSWIGTYKTEMLLVNLNLEKKDPSEVYIDSLNNSSSIYVSFLTIHHLNKQHMNFSSFEASHA